MNNELNGYTALGSAIFHQRNLDLICVKHARPIGVPSTINIPRFLRIE